MTAFTAAMAHLAGFVHPTLGRPASGGVGVVRSLHPVPAHAVSHDEGGMPPCQ